MHALIALQVAFCFVVLFVAGLFVETFERLSNQPTGFSSERLLALDTVAQNPQPPALWSQVAEHLRAEGRVVTKAAWLEVAYGSSSESTLVFDKEMREWVRRHFPEDPHEPVK